MTLTQIKPLGLSKPVDLADNEKIRLGTGNDLQIYHDGTNNVIAGSTASDINIESYFGADVNIVTNSNHYAIKCISNAQVELYHDNSKKFETTSQGINISGDTVKINSTGTTNLVVGSTDASGAVLVLDGDSNGDASGTDYSYIEHDSAGNLNIVQDNPAAGGRIDFLTGGAGRVSMQADKFRPANNNAMTLGTSGLRWSDLYLANDLYLNDNGVLRFGTSGSDLLMQHTGGHNFMEGGSGFSGNLYIRAKLNENGIVLKSDNAVELYYDASKKFQTTSWGGSVTGTLVASSNIKTASDTGKFLAGASDDLQLFHDGSNSKLISSSGRLHLENTNGIIRTNTDHGFYVQSADGNTTHAEIDSEGLKFNGDTAAANAFDDYEYGTFTPTILGDNSSSNQSGYAWRYGSYTKIGRLVHVRVAMGLSDGFSSNFSSCFIGLPLTAYSDHGNSNFDYIPLLGYNYNSGKGDSGSNEAFFLEVNGHSVNSFRIVKGNGKNNINQNDLNTGQRFAISFCYQGGA